MKLFSKEKDTILKIVNCILIVGAIISTIIALGTGISILNKQPVLTYDEYAKEVCTIDKLEYEGTDEEGREEYNDAVKKTCTEYYLQAKKEQTDLNKTNTNNFLISLSATFVLLITVHILNKKI